MEKLLMLSVAVIIPDHLQPRQHFEQDAIDRMEASIKARGILQPIRVRYDAERGLWLLVSGECRWRAAKQAGLDVIPALPVESELSEADRLSDQLIENEVRNDLLPMDFARSLVRLRTLKGVTAEALAAELGMSNAKISRAAKLLTLPEDIQAMIDGGRVPADSGYHLTKLADDEASQRELAQQIASGRLSRDATAAAVQDRLPPKDRKPQPARETYRLPGGVTIAVTAAVPLTYDNLLLAIERIRKQAETLRKDGKPLAELPASLAEPVAKATKAKPARAKAAKAAELVPVPSLGENPSAPGA